MHIDPLLLAQVPWDRLLTPAGVEVWRLVWLTAAILIGWIAGRVLALVLRYLAKSFERRNRHYVALTLQSLARGLVPLAVVWGLKIGSASLVLSPAANAAVDTVLAVLFVLAAAYALWRLIDVVENWLIDLASRTTSKLDDMLAPMIGGSLRVSLVVLALVQIATTISQKPPSAIIAGLGVGGLAIGLAAQDTIKNFFGSLMIFSDRPFELGDRICAGDFDGTVEAVGFRSTRLRTLDGHLVTLPNGDLANKPIRNISRRMNIKRSFKLGLTYDTPPDRIREAVTIVERMLEDHEGQNPELPARVHFNELADSALVIQVTFWYHPADWWAFSDYCQRLQLEILTAFEAAGIELAFPTQTVHLVREA